MSARESKTRKKMVDVARQLFAEKGKKSVTMNDIAEKAAKGRRTLYTYFKSKDEIYKAVITEELRLLFESVAQVVAKTDLAAKEMLREFILTHLDGVKNAVRRNGTLSSDFFRDIYEVERVRRKVDIKEIRLIQDILERGVKNGEFKRINLEISSTIIFYSLKGVEVPYIKQGLSNTFERNKRSIVEFILRGIEA